MSNRNTIVSYREVKKLISGNESATQSELDSLADTPAESARMLAGFAAALKSLEAADRNPGVLIAPDHKVASLLLSFLAERANEKGEFQVAPMGSKEAKFDSRDWLGWAGIFFKSWRKIRPHDFLPAAAAPDALGDKIRVALLGDWGTGLYGAPVCARAIAQDPKGYGLAVHLGDVYYAGNDDEVQERFLKLWPRNSAINRALNSNHEMYTGGHAYFDRTLKDFHQTASYFALQNAHWVLVGLDTGYKDHDLAGGQVEWLRNIVSGAGDRKVILLSHHQPFSWFEKDGENLVEKLGDLLSGGKIFAWYWGHEHRCVLYDKHASWGMYGRTVGHGGFPYFRDKVSGLPQAPGMQNWYQLKSGNLVPGGVVLDGPNVYVEGHEREYGPNGYMTLEFDGPRLNEIVQAADGTVLYDRPLA